MISDEAVEAAARIVYRTSGRRRVMSYDEARDECLSEAKEILEAASPFIAAQSASAIREWIEKDLPRVTGVRDSFEPGSPVWLINNGMVLAYENVLAEPVGADTLLRAWT